MLGRWTYCFTCPADGKPFADRLGRAHVLGLSIDPNTGALLICGADGKVWRIPGVAAPAI
ncbi:MAG: hypothetical protein ACR2H0_03925 [Candidatus Limnocylindrales bacterium]